MRLVAEIWQQSGLKQDIVVTKLILWFRNISPLLSKTTYVTQSEKTGLIAHVIRFDFSPRTQSYMNKNQLDLSGLALLAAFPKPSGDPCVRCGALMELWSAWG